MSDLTVSHVGTIVESLCYLLWEHGKAGSEEDRLADRLWAVVNPEETIEGSEG